jgi:hypothetical protein
MVMRRSAVVVVALTVLGALPDSALAVGHSEMAVQHTLTNGVFANAEWYSNTPTRYSDVVVGVVRPRHGASMLDLTAYYQTFDSNGVLIEDTFIVTDTTTGFHFTSNPTGLGTATLVGHVPVTICTDYFSVCNPGTASLTVTWTGSGPIVRGADAGPPGVQPPPRSGLVLFNEHVSGSSQTAAATGTLNTNPLTALNLYSAAIGAVRDGSIFVCFDAGCEN